MFPSNKLESAIKSDDYNVYQNQINLNVTFPIILICLTLTLFITLLFCVNCSFCPPKCCLDQINPGEQVAGGTVAKFITTISVLLLLTITLIANVLITTNQASQSNQHAKNKKFQEDIDKFSYLMFNGSDGLQVYKNLYEDSIKVNNVYKEINDAVNSLRSMDPSKYLISDYTDATSGYIKAFEDTFGATSVTYPDGSSGKTQVIDNLSTSVNDLNVSVSQCFDRQNVAQSNLYQDADDLKNDQLKSFQTIKYNFGLFLDNDIKKIQESGNEAYQQIGSYTASLVTYNDSVNFGTNLIQWLIQVIIVSVLVTMFVIGVLGDNRKQMIIIVQINWWMTGFAAIVASVYIFQAIPLGLGMRDFCQVANTKGPNYENLLSASTQTIFSDCSQNSTPLVGVLEPFLSIPADIQENSMKVSAQNQTTCKYKESIDIIKASVESENTYVIPSELFTLQDTQRVSTQLGNLNKLTNIKNINADSRTLNCSFVKDTFVFNKNNCAGLYEQISPSSTDSDNAMQDKQRCLLISEWTSGDGASNDIMLRQDTALTFCEASVKAALKTEISDNFNKIKDYQNDVIAKNSNLVNNLDNLYMNNNNNTGLLVKHNNVKDLYDQNVAPTLEFDINGQTAGSIMELAYNIMQSNCQIINESMRYLLYNQCGENLNIIYVTVWYLSVSQTVMLVLTCLLVLQSRQNNKDAMHIYDVVMVREELRDEFSKIENQSFYGRDDNQEQDDAENQLNQIDEEKDEDNDEEKNEDNGEVENNEVENNEVENNEVENGEVENGEVEEQNNNDKIDGGEE